MAGRAASRALDQVSRTWRPIVLLPLIVVAGALVVALVAKAHGVPLHEVSSDPAALTDSPAFFGLLSFLTFGAWAVAIGAALVGAAAGRRRGSALAPLLLQGAAITAWLLLDDMFQFHELGIPDYLHVDEHLVLGLYPIAVAIWLWANRSAVGTTDWLLLVAAAAFFFLSILLDELLAHLVPGPFAEDVPKLVGVVLWSTWFIRTAVQATEDAAEPADAGVPRGGTRV